MQRILLMLICLAGLVSSGFSEVSHTTTTMSPSTNSTMNNLIPMPVSVVPGDGTFILNEDTKIYVENESLTEIGEYLADRLRPATGYELPVLISADVSAGNFYLTTMGGDAALGAEGYQLTITPDGVQLVADQPAGLFWGVQTIRQLLPPVIERPVVQDGPWTIPAGTIIDYPRFEWRGAMLDVARHFFSVEEVKRTIDLLAYYKINRFHLHLADDQGWRIMINSWPELAVYGGSTEVGGGDGGYYTQEEYADMVAYAQSQYMMVIPEIDMPGHINAALASYAELNCDGVAPELYTGTRVGFSTLCIDKDITYTFVDDVVREIAALTPGPYFHIGGDEASSTSEDDYRRFVTQAQEIVQSHGKQMIGWEEIAKADLLDTSIVQYWFSGSAQKAVQQGAKVIMSPAPKTYLDMKYDASTPLGLNWAGYIDVPDAYNWDPATYLEGVGESDILGVEAPLWSETLETIEDIEFMAFPRLCAYAEMGWSPAAGRSWDEFRIRLGTHGPRMGLMNVNYYPAPSVPWQP